MLILTINNSVHPPLVIALVHVPCFVDDAVQVVFVLCLFSQNAVALELRFLKHLVKFELFVRQLWVPKVEDQVDTRVVAVVPGFVVE